LASAEAPITSLQPPYSLVATDVQDAILPYALSQQIGVIVYSPMGSGLLTAAMTREPIASMPKDDWRKQYPNFQEPLLSRNLQLVERPLFTAEFLSVISENGVKSVKLPPRSPNLNAVAERFVRSIKESCLNRMIFFGEESLRKAIENFVAHYHSERNHQGLRNQLISPDAGHLGSAGEIQRRQRLGGMLNYYYRAAA
jgi:hypothetical protein